MSARNSLSLLHPVDISDLKQGNTSVPYAHRLDSGRPGPEVLITALVHGNELCGAHALRRLLDLGLRPKNGALTACFCNVAAYDSYDASFPARSRFIDEDFNRVWELRVLEGARRSTELDRAREIRQFVDRADYLLDLHSMQSGDTPLMLSGVRPEARRLAERMGFPDIIFADAGHASGLRMRDHGRFGSGEAVALLAECGQHLDPRAAEHASEIVARFLLTIDLIDRASAEKLSPLRDHPAPRTIEGTGRVTVRHRDFRFTIEPASLDVIPEQGTVIAMDGEQPVRTPHDHCVLVMPSRRLAPGQTAVRLGRYVD